MKVTIKQFKGDIEKARPSLPLETKTPWFSIILKCLNHVWRQLDIITIKNERGVLWDIHLGGSELVILIKKGILTDTESETLTKMISNH